MLITIDSNVGSIPQLIAEKLPTPGIRWCTMRDQCPNVSSNDGIFYNTPVGLMSDLSNYKLPNDALHFVYVDFSKNQFDLSRLLKNIRSLRNVVVISNGDAYSTGQYALTIGNCTEDDVAEVISGIIVVHLEFGFAVSEDAVTALLSDGVYVPSEDSATDQKIYNVYNILDSKRSTSGEISDCYECKI